MSLRVSDADKASGISAFSSLLSNQLDKHTDSLLADTKQSCEEPKLSKEESQETRHLKELLLLHLDLVQQQQELLHLKDRQLQQLTHEKDSVIVFLTDLI